MKKIYFYAIFIASISTSYAQSCQDCFITTWNTEAGDSGGTTIKLPIVSGAYDVDINNDGDFDDDNETNRTGSITITFESAGTKTIQVRPNPTNNTAGELEIDHNASGSTPQKLTSIDKWGTIVWKSDTGRNFLGCSNLTIADDAGAPNLTAVTSTHAMFANCTNLTGDLSGWNVSNVTDASVMFAGATSFTSDLSSWSVSNVINSRAMFRGASNFDSDLSSWDVSLVTDMNEMFENASSFNSDLSSWNVSVVTNMKEMFDGASNFTSDLSNWDVSSVTNLQEMLFGTTSFKAQDYNALLVVWSSLTLQSNVTFGAPPVSYCADGETGRNILTGTYSWNITGDGSLDCPFITTWDTTIPNHAVANPNINNARITLPISGGAYDVDGNNDGDLNDDVDLTNVTGTQTINYGTGNEGIKTIAIRPNPTNNTNNQLQIILRGADSQNKLIAVEQWGTEIVWTSMENAFRDTTSMTISENAGAPNLTKVKSMVQMFRNSAIGSVDLTSWNVSQVTNMNSMFYDSDNFNGDLSTWDVSNVINMNSMFKDNDNFSGDLSSWNVSQVAEMNSMFSAATSFNSDLSSWDVSNVINMDFIFSGAINFNSDLSSWNVSNVINMWSSFELTTSFNSDLSSWDVSKVTSMNRMFSRSTNFNSDLSSWNVSNVISMNSMFFNATNFNSDLSSWNVSQVTVMASMFKGATSFSSENYNALLTGWSALPTLQSGVSFGAPPADYCKQAERDILTGTYGWDISGDGNLIDCPVEPLILTFDTRAGQTSSNTRVYIPITGGSYDIDFGNDGTYEDLNNTGPQKPWLTPAGIHTIRIRPSASNTNNQLAINADLNDLNGVGFMTAITSIDKWGDIVWTSMENAFPSASNLTIAEDAGVPNLTMVTNMNSMFSGNANLNSDLSSWDVSSVTNMEFMFSGATIFNSDLSSWDVSNVTDMSWMFSFATNFNSDLSSWNVSNVTDMNKMFRNASGFDADISTWDVSNVTDMLSTFDAVNYPINFSDYNYEKLLAGWSSLPTLQSGVAFTAPPASYCKGGTGRDKLTDAVADGGYGWTITGDEGSSCSNLALSIDAFLQGPYDTTTNKMDDGLRTASAIPDTSPYEDETFAVNRPFDVATGDDVIVDWVQVSLHNPNDASIIISSTSALLQRDGDVVVSDGINALQIQGIAGNYKVSINHRNHIPVITDAAQSLSTTETAIDFTNDLTIVTGGSNAMAEVATGIYALFSGDVNGNNQVQVDDYNAAIQDVGRGGYLDSDVDMNGELQVSDINFVLKTLGKGAQF